MKTVKILLSLWMVVMLASSSAVLAQGRGNGYNNPGRGHNKENPGRGHGHDRYDERNDHDRYHDHYYSSGHDGYPHHRYVTYSHHRYGRPSWAPVYGHHYNTRYIYYSDYNVYYDCHRDVFITWTGRNWAVSASIPVFMARVDFRKTAVAGVDYWGDDFGFYMSRRHPVFISLQASW